ncbi:MAG: translation initiation factor IF-2 N-terminal domain-containing protein, partial [Gallicola sp.]|nr:translation initiation factor IF-2 N-terminal domain-containing protein [Gallicola sp.]
MFLLSKIRVHALAKELGLSSKELVDKILELGIDVKNHMSTIEATQVEFIVNKIAPADSVVEEKSKAEN